MTDDNSVSKGPRRVGESHQNKPLRFKRRVFIVPKFLPPGYRFLCPEEQVESTDFYWSKRNKCYLPMKGKPGGWAGLAGDVLPFIRSKDES